MELNEQPTRAPLAPRGLCILAVFLLAVLFSSPTVADYRDSYKAGVDAFEAGDWALATQHLEAAVAQASEAKGGVRRYTPHFYLGLAQVERGLCRAAIPRLDEAERQGKVKSKDLESLNRSRQRCVDLVNRIDATRIEAQSAIDEANSAAAAVRRVEASPVLTADWESGGNSFGSRQTHWTAQIANARQFLAEGDERLDADRIREAQRIATDAMNNLRAVESEAVARRRDLQPVVDSRLRDIAKAVSATQRDLAFVRNYLSPLPEALVDTLAAADEAIAGAQAANSATPIPELDYWLEQVNRELRQLRSAVKAPPDELMQATAAYFRGDYGQSLEMLDSLDSNEARVASQICLFRSAALFALARLDSLADPATLERQLRRCQELDAVIVPPADKFSPDFLAVWSTVVEAVSPPTDGG